MPTWGKTLLTGLATFIVGLAVAGSGDRPRPLQDVGALIALVGIIVTVRGVVQWFRRGSAPTLPHP